MVRSVKICGALVLLSAIPLMFMDWYVSERSSMIMSSPGRKYVTEKELLGRNNTTDLSKMAHAKYSRMFVEGHKTVTYLGDKIQVRIDLYDNHGRRRLIGGDYLRLWMENVGLKAYIAGEVFDHNNGSYTGFVRASWVGKGVIRVFIARRREEIALYYTLYKEYVSIWDIQARFVNRQISESTSCSIVPYNDTWIDWCNFTSVNWDFPWFCRKPINPNLTCDTWTYTNSQRLIKINLDPKKKALYMWSRKFLVDILPQKQTVDVLKRTSQVTEATFLRQASISCNKLPPEVTWQRQQPNGFFYNDTWQSSLCKDTLTRNTNTYKECLKNKTLWLPGDSTSRQFFRSILHIVQVRYEPGAAAHAPKTVSNEEYNFTLKWFAHELPFYHGPSLHHRSVNIAQHSILENLSNTSQDIIVLYLNVHIILVHPDVFRRHVQRLVLSAKNVLSRAPRVTFAVRGPHAFYRAIRFGLLSYWGLIYTDILHEEFSSINDKIVYLDFWDMTAAKPCYDVHCPENVIAQMVHNMMSYLCFRSNK